jgi:hypothetical protein
MSRKNEARATANAEKAKQFDAFQESQKTELQKAQDRAERAETAAAEAQAERLRMSAVNKYKLDADFSDLLGGGTEAEIDARAERIAKVINDRVEAIITSRNGNGQPQRQPGQRPVESMRPGGAPSTSSTNPQTPDQIFRGMIDQRRGA